MSIVSRFKTYGEMAERHVDMSNEELAKWMFSECKYLVSQIQQQRNRIDRLIKNQVRLQDELTSGD